jgi:hypothetical protein
MRMLSSRRWTVCSPPRCSAQTLSPSSRGSTSRIVSDNKHNQLILDNGVSSLEVPGGLPASAYRMCTIMCESLLVSHEADGQLHPTISPSSCPWPNVARKTPVVISPLSNMILLCRYVDIAVPMHDLISPSRKLPRRYRDWIETGDIPPITYRANVSMTSIAALL